MSFLESLHPFFQTPGDDEPNIAYFVARLHEEGRCWAAEYTRPEHVDLMTGAQRALQALRSRRLEEGSGMLRRVEALFRDAESAASPEVYHVLGRWFYGLLAYHRYCLEDYRGAEEALDRGHEEVRQAIERKRFLLPYAMECYGFWFQRVRIARGQRAWPEMWRRVEVTRGIAMGEIPCCVLGDGTAIGVHAVQEIYQGFQGLTKEELQALAPVIDEAGRSRQLRLFLAEIYAPPGFVIPYAPGPA